MTPLVLGVQIIRQGVQSGVVLITKLVLAGLRTHIQRRVSTGRIGQQELVLALVVGTKITIRPTGGGKVTASVGSVTLLGSYWAWHVVVVLAPPTGTVTTPPMQVERWVSCGFRLEIVVVVGGVLPQGVLVRYRVGGVQGEGL